MIDKCCGTCKWWRLSKNDEFVGYCDIPITITPRPASVLPLDSFTCIMARGEGSGCPCWEAAPCKS